MKLPNIPGGLTNGMSDDDLSRHAEVIIKIMIAYCDSEKINPLDVCVLGSYINGYLMMRLKEHSMVQVMTVKGEG